MADFRSLESKEMRNVKKPFRDRFSIFIGALVGIGATNGSALAAENPADRATIARQLIEAGFIAPYLYPGWYVVNRPLLNRTVRDAENGVRAQRSIVEKLKEIVGPGVDIREVDIFEAHVGTQDHM